MIYKLFIVGRIVSPT